MTELILVDSNLLLLLVVGTADRSYIGLHKRLSGYGEDEFELLVGLIGRSELVFVPHVLTEVSNLSRYISNPDARSIIRAKLREFIEGIRELPVGSRSGARRSEFPALGLTDSVLLDLCKQGFGELRFTLLTRDFELANSAEMLGCRVVPFPPLL